MVLDIDESELSVFEEESITALCLLATALNLDTLLLAYFIKFLILLLSPMAQSGWLSSYTEHGLYLRAESDQTFNLPINDPYGEPFEIR